MLRQEPGRPRLEPAGFFLSALDGWDRKQWLSAYYLLARHLPGFGGLTDYNQLEEADVLVLLRKLRESLEREAAAWKR